MEPSDRDSRPEANPPIRVLIVDDHRMVAESLASALTERAGIEVVATASTAAEGLDKALAYRPDVVLMDYRLPDENGVVASKRLLARMPELKIAMITSFPNEEVIIGAVEAGCVGFVPKDQPVDEVARAIVAAVRGEAVISPSVLARVLPRLRRRGGPSEGLSPRELDVLRLLAEGLGNDAIAAQLSLTRNTVRNHAQRILTKLGAHSRLEAVAVAARQGLVTFPGRAAPP